ncbi:MAG TPA: site-specific DNA-methyltransferase [Spirochaetia bacterium]|nr:site-specific DNA-methyltransferase [Spirochaetia bacterium]
MTNQRFATDHRLYLADARKLSFVTSDSIDLIVTSPPYPMIEMWDESFCNQAPTIRISLENNAPENAYELMHALLDDAWDACFRVLRPGGFACINIGDATRTFDSNFRLFTNHARIVTACERSGFTSLPPIVWRKTTNAPNKFMGSGMYPAGAYVTLEHEYILVFRKPGKRSFATGDDQDRRRRSAFFWEERNAWFSDLWNVPGVRQSQLDRKQSSNRSRSSAEKRRGAAVLPGASRTRSGAFPFEIALRLVLMHSIEGDTVLDPFTGTGTTQMAALATGRNSVGSDLAPDLIEQARNVLLSAQDAGNDYLEARLEAHRQFEAATRKAGNTLRYQNAHYGFSVKTLQERTILLRPVTAIEEVGDLIVARY